MLGKVKSILIPCLLFVMNSAYGEISYPDFTKAPIQSNNYAESYIEGYKSGQEQRIRREQHRQLQLQNRILQEEYRQKLLETEMMLEAQEQLELKKQRTKELSKSKS